MHTQRGRCPDGQTLETDDYRSKKPATTSSWRICKDLLGPPGSTSCLVLLCWAPKLGRETLCCFRLLHLLCFALVVSGNNSIGKKGPRCLCVVPGGTMVVCVHACLCICVPVCGPGLVDLGRRAIWGEGSASMVAQVSLQLDIQG